MKILEKEIALREETRAAQQAKPQLKAADFEGEAISLAATQDELAERTEIVIEKIHELPDGAQQFGKEIQQLTGAVNAMWDASDILGEFNTGPKAIAAESEAIEWLLQAKRSKGGGGGSPGDGNRDGKDTNMAALALLGQSDEDQAQFTEREVQQATGKSGQELPAEFRAGLDQYFEALERGGE